MTKIAVSTYNSQCNFGVEYKLPIIGNKVFNYQHEITYSVSIIYSVHGNNGGVKSTKKSPSNGRIMLQHVSSG